MAMEIVKYFYDRLFLAFQGQFVLRSVVVIPKRQCISLLMCNRNKLQSKNQFFVLHD